MTRARSRSCLSIPSSMTGDLISQRTIHAEINRRAPVLVVSLDGALVVYHALRADPNCR